MVYAIEDTENDIVFRDLTTIYRVILHDVICAFTNLGQSLDIVLPYSVHISISCVSNEDRLLKTYVRNMKVFQAIGKLANAMELKYKTLNSANEH